MRKSDVAVVAQCRGEGVGYVAFASHVDCPRLDAHARLTHGNEIPCALYPVDTPSVRERIAPGWEHVWVATMPLLVRSCVVELREREGERGDQGQSHRQSRGQSEGAPAAVVCRTVFSAKGSKVASRLLTARKPHVAAALRGYERRYGEGHTKVSIDEAWPADAGKVAWRVRATFPAGDAVPKPSLAVFDERGRAVDAPIVTMEDHVVPSVRDARLPQRLVTFSALVPEETASFYVVASLGAGACQGTDSHADAGACQDTLAPLHGFAGMNAPRARGMVAHARHMAGGAPVDGRYEEWFEQHRATSAELDRQRETVATWDEDDSPLISIVMPVYRTPSAFLTAAIRSVVEQSYGRWELVVVDASGPCDEVDQVLASFDDRRIRVLSIENRTIAENTNEGVAAARGAYVAFLDHDDVLEPDALWWYVQAIREHPETDLLYCDEDHLAGTHVHAPAFKTYPNFGKLYTHNYVTHLLMVSRYVLERTERSGAEVAGAQDYDLTLKAFEAARHIEHVPRVLYHWREHEGSTSGGENQKPFAHEAGRRALEAHLARRSIASRVDDGPLPYTYRVRYELPEPQGLVSVVIPTRDQSELLRLCVTSILERTTYPRLEVVLVENNSQELETFALYDELVARDDRVRVVTWVPSVPGEFNYSAIVNHGVSCASGSYVVLLNNDTEVIEPTWVEEMMGHLMRPEVGVVGAKLLFGDGLIQHVGMVANPSGDNCHVCQNLTRDAPGAGYAALMPGDYSLVTGACQMVRKSLFDELGGYDENLAVGFNDTDFCLRAREAGFAVTVAPYALLHHREFSTRGREVADVRLKQRFLEEKTYVMARHAQFYAQGDPALNPNVDGYSSYFALG